jgi:hypothetical protein
LIENEDCAKILTEKQYVPIFFSLNSQLGVLEVFMKKDSEEEIRFILKTCVEKLNAISGKEGEGRLVQLEQYE